MSRVTPRVHLPRGLPGSGKSTLARRLAADTGAAHVELDGVRRTVWPSCPPSWDPYSGPGLDVQHAFEQAVLEVLASGRDVIADRTFLDPRAAHRLRRLAPDAEFVIHDLRHVPLATCIARDAGRPEDRQVGADGIRDLHRRWIAPPGHHTTATVHCGGVNTTPRRNP